MAQTSGLQPWDNDVRCGLSSARATAAQAPGESRGHRGHSLTTPSYLPWNTVFSFCSNLLLNCQTPGG